MRTAAPDAMKQYLWLCISISLKDSTTLKEEHAAYAESGVKTTGVVR